MQNLILECVVRATLIAICSAVVLYLLRVKAARVRHSVWASVVVLMLVLPGWTAWGPRAVLRVLNPATTPAVSQTLLAVETVAQPVLPAGTIKPSSSPWTWRSILISAYLLGFCVLLARLAIGTVRALLLIRRAANRDGRLTSDACAAPITVGWLKPAVILPERWQGWPPAQLNAVLTHEGEHARRRDPLVQWLALLNRAIFWFHPLAWWLERRLSTLAEEACDAAVLAGGHDPLQYSEYLLEMARTVQLTGARISVVGMAMPGASLPQRIRRILEEGLTQGMSRARTVCLAVACAVVSTIFVAGAVGHTQARPESPAATSVEKSTAVTPPSTDLARKKPTLLLAQAQTSRAKPQSGTAAPDGGSVSGTVEDPSGARIPVSCVISARNQSGAIAIVTHTDEAGAYRLSSLPPGRYRLEFAMPGFALRTIETEVEAGKQARIDAVLDLGQVDEREIVSGGVSGGVVGGISSGVPGGVPGGVPQKPVRIRVGGSVQAVRLVARVPPVYPPELERQGIEGVVVIRAVISRDGVPLNPHVLNTEIDPRFAQAALDSVKLWRYQPSLLNGQPVETATTITVEFRRKE
ncbi:MAG TPA: M56 family metallopeptidase [Bryobacteraceae bacterium]|nr:M56 family metallopeptidase [Bryobacteraceae bacterium]